MSTEYPAGTVAIATVEGVEGIRVFRYQGFGGELHWDSSEPVKNEIVHMDVELTDIRPLVVLDLDKHAREVGWSTSSSLIDALAAQGFNNLATELRLQTKPPRIPEPGLWGVVASDTTFHCGPAEFVRRKADGHEDWQDGVGEWFAWSDLTDPTLVREGIQS